MKFYAVTTFSDEGYKQYAKKMIRSFDHHWDEDVQLMVFSDSPIDCGNKGRIENFFLTDFPEIYAFNERHKDNKQAQGKEPLKQFNHFWKDVEKEKGYNYRYDAIRFHYSAMIPYLAAQKIVEEAVLIFLDADVITYKKVTKDFLKKRIPKKYNCSYLGRQKTHTETGFLMFRLPECFDFLKTYYNVFNHDEFMHYDQWNNSHVFDVVRQTMKIKAHNLSPTADTGETFTKSPLIEKMCHLKGNKKEAAKTNVKEMRDKWA